MEQEKQRRTSRDKRKDSVCEEASEPQISVSTDGEAKKGKPLLWMTFVVLFSFWQISLLSPLPSVTPSDSVVRRSISQQNSGVSVTIDDPIRTARQLSPPHGKVSSIIHVTNLVRLKLIAQHCKAQR